MPAAGRRARWAAAIGFGLVGALLALPAEVGWDRSAISRETFLAALARWHDVPYAVKLVHRGDGTLLLDVLAGPPRQPPQDDQRFWVVVSRYPPTVPAGGWHLMGVVPDDPSVFGSRKGGQPLLTGLRAPDLGNDESPYDFEALRDRSFPGWWPVRVTGRAAWGLAAVAASTGVVVAVAPLGRRRRRAARAGPTPREPAEH